MKQRIITAIIALIIFLPILWYGGWPLEALLVLLAIIAVKELFTMKKHPIRTPEFVLTSFATASLLVGNHFLGSNEATFNYSPFALFLFSAILMLSLTVFRYDRINFDDVAVFILGALYIGVGFNGIIITRNISFSAVLLLFIIIWSTDSFAYLIGRRFGKHKLAPHISPNKTIEGSVGGSLVTALVALVFNFFFQPIALRMIIFIIMVLFISVSGQIGDLVESSFKRYYKVKDSGNLLPGHGGVMDRFDSTFFAMFAFQIVLALLSYY